MAQWLKHLVYVLGFREGPGSNLNSGHFFSTITSAIYAYKSRGLVAERSLMSCHVGRPCHPENPENPRSFFFFFFSRCCMGPKPFSYNLIDNILPIVKRKLKTIAFFAVFLIYIHFIFDPLNRGLI